MSERTKINDLRARVAWMGTPRAIYRRAREAQASSDPVEARYARQILDRMDDLRLAPPDADGEVTP